MPVRVKPVHDVGPCFLNRDSIKGICALVDASIPYASYSASDGVWEIYDEDSASFLTAIADHDKLDSFYAVAPTEAMHEQMQSAYVDQFVQGTQEALPLFDTSRKLNLSFDKEQARVAFELPPADLDWTEHFMLDLGKHVHRRGRQEEFRNLGARYFLTFVTASLAFGLMGSSASMLERAMSGDYARIILKQKEPNRTARSIRDNLASSIIYDILKYGIVFALGGLALWIYNRFGVNITQWFSAPSIPTR